MRYLTIIFILINNPIFGQITDRCIPEKQEIYLTAFDSLIDLLSKEKVINKIILKGDQKIIKNIPDIFKNIDIEKITDERNIKSRSLIKNDLLIFVNENQSDNNETIIRFRTFEKTKNSMSFFSDGIYLFIFYFDLVNKTFRLVRTESGITL